MRIGVIVEHLQLSEWQIESLTGLNDAEFVLFNCTNVPPRARRLKHAFYYVLNLVSLRTPATRSRAIPDGMPVVERVDFQSELDGAWQSLPPLVLDCIEKEPPFAIIKFGMGLLRVPERLGCAILSYHHGDPRRYRGRPAGFYELLAGDTAVGQIVQILSNRIDSGSVVAFAETKVHRHSYRATMAEAYRCSPLLLARALKNIQSGTFLDLAPTGKNYRLPSNWTVLRFAGSRIRSKIVRLLYGAFQEKSWQVAQAQLQSLSPERTMSNFPSRSEWVVFRCPRAYRFLADPFPHPEHGLLVEALRKRNQQGEIILVDAGYYTTLCTGPGHFSYPGTIQAGGDWFIAPEISEWAAPRLYRIADGGCPGTKLNIDQSLRLIDPTFHASSEGTVYLFANEGRDGPGVLRLWTAPSLFERFSEHPASPIRISPRASRMGGGLCLHNGGLFRVGQDGTGLYGNGVLLFKVLELTRERFSEIEIGSLRFEDVRGPHTLNFRGNAVFFDFYRDRFSLLAGLRRWRSQAAKSRAHALGARDR